MENRVKGKSAEEDTQTRGTVTALEDCDENAIGGDSHGGSHFLKNHHMDIPRTTYICCIKSLLKVKRKKNLTLSKEKR